MLWKNDGGGGGTLLALCVLSSCPIHSATSAAALLLHPPMIYRPQPSCSRKRAFHSPRSSLAGQLHLDFPQNALKSGSSASGTTQSDV